MQSGTPSRASRRKWGRLNEPTLRLAGLTSIAERYGSSVDDISRTNQITDPTQISIGQVLIIPGGPGVSENVQTAKIIIRKQH